jgi:adenylate cyclase, class 2
MLELEAKMKLDPAGIDALSRRLREHGAVLVGEFLEQNTFYDTDDRAMLAADEGLRVRTSRDLATGKSRTIVTHKGPNRHGPLKTREETEAEVASTPDIEALLQRLGFIRYLGFEKKRQSWKLEGCKIELDEVPHLGHFVEIEGPSEDVILRLRTALKLADLPLIKASYVAMLSSYIQERGQTTNNITFPTHPASPRVAKAG